MISSINFNFIMIHISIYYIIGFAKKFKIILFSITYKRQCSFVFVFLLLILFWNEEQNKTALHKN